jgi:hypothetical protein
MDEKMDCLTGMTVKEHRLIKKLKLKNEKEFVRNPYTGNGVNLTTLQVAIYDLIKGCEAIGNRGQDFQTGISMFQKYWPREYMILLD